jgi:hypothetical protein
MEKQSASKTANLVIAGTEYVKNEFYRMQPPVAKTLMGILERGLYESRGKLEYGPENKPNSSIPEIPSKEVKKYLYHVPPVKSADPMGTLTFFRQRAILRGDTKEIEPGYVIKEKYVGRLIALYEATHDEKRVGEQTYRIKAMGILRKDPAPRGVVEPSKPPNQGVVKRTTFIVGPGGGNQDWRRNMIFKGGPDDGHAAAKPKAAP